jgi:hypothetical protein
MLPGPFSYDVEASGYARWWSEQSSTQWGRRQVLPNRAGGPGWQSNFDRIDFELKPEMDMVTITLEKAVTISRPSAVSALYCLGHARSEPDFVPSARFDRSQTERPCAGHDSDKAGCASRACRSA